MLLPGYPCFSLAAYSHARIGLFSRGLRRPFLTGSGKVIEQNQAKHLHMSNMLCFQGDSEPKSIYIWHGVLSQAINLGFSR